MFQYLPHRRRLCDEPDQVHPPAAPAALERKHPVDARQQLRPHIARSLSRPRGAGNFAYRLWPGCLAPRCQLPAGLRRNQRTGLRDRPPKSQHFSIFDFLAAVGLDITQFREFIT